jgi:succinyl-CoA synthetase alpha subunit
MMAYGTNVVAGVTPGKGGQEVEGVPVCNTVAESVDRYGANTSIIFVPARFTRDAAMEAIDAGISTIAVITEGIPLRDSIELLASAEQKGGVDIIGPNCPGMISPAHHTKVGIMPSHIFVPGDIGIASRSGSLTYEIAWRTTQAGFGQSTCVGIGGDPIIGDGFVDILEKFRNDDETRQVVLIGEIGGNAEELAARYIIDTQYPKPVVAYIAGRTAPPGKQMGHAGAIIMGEAGTARSKVDAFNEAGVPVAQNPADLSGLLKQ